MTHDRQSILEELQSKLKALNETTWERRAAWPRVESWLAQFASSTDLDNDEQLQMLFLVSHFIYFGSREIRWLLRSMYKDLYQSQVIRSIRQNLGDTRDRNAIEAELIRSLRSTRFLGIGNPSESGSHLLYYFRQENRLGKEYFIHSGQILTMKGFSRIRLLKIADETAPEFPGQVSPLK